MNNILQLHLLHKILLDELVYKYIFNSEIQV